MNNNFEDILKGNKFHLTKEQHFIPISSIKRFLNNNKVYLKNLKIKNKKVVMVNASDDIFKVKRLWSQSCEKGYMKLIEDKFQKVVDTLLKNNSIVINDKENNIISEMYLLWKYRVYFIEEFLEKETLFIKLNGIKGDNHTKIVEEQLESMLLSYVNSNGEISSRDVIGFQIQLKIIDDLQYYKKINWMLIHAGKDNFIMPSNPFMDSFWNDNILNDTIYFPINEKLCLVPYSSIPISNEMISDLNSLMIKNSKWFYFWK